MLQINSPFTWNSSIVVETSAFHENLANCTNSNCSTKTFLVTEEYQKTAAIYSFTKLSAIIDHNSGSTNTTQNHTLSNLPEEILPNCPELPANLQVGLVLITFHQMFCLYSMLHSYFLKSHPKVEMTSIYLTKYHMPLSKIIV